MIDNEKLVREKLSRGIFDGAERHVKQTAIPRANVKIMTYKMPA
jgi:hypothetical protein